MYFNIIVVLDCTIIYITPIFCFKLILFIFQKGKRKVKEPKTELDKVQSLFHNMEINKNVPKRFRLLYKHATTFMQSSGDSIQIPCDAEVFGIEKRIFILYENIVALLEFNMIGQAAIAAYMA